jgi:hypothetical protein
MPKLNITTRKPIIADLHEPAATDFNAHRPLSPDANQVAQWALSYRGQIT